MPMIKTLASFVVFFAPQKQRDSVRCHPSLPSPPQTAELSKRMSFRWKTETPCSTVQPAVQQKYLDLKSATCTSCGWPGCSTRLPPPKLRADGMKAQRRREPRCSKMGRNAARRTTVPYAGRRLEPGLHSQNPHLLPRGAQRSRPLPVVTVKGFVFRQQRMCLYFLSHKLI